MLGRSPKGAALHCRVSGAMEQENTGVLQNPAPLVIVRLANLLFHITFHITDNLTEFLVEKFIPTRPINFRMHLLNRRRQDYIWLHT